MQPQYSRADRLAWRYASGAVLVLPLAGPVACTEVVTLRGTGEDVWELLTEPHTAAALAQRLADRYGAPRSTVLAELPPVLDDLAYRGVLVRTDRP